MRQIIRDLLEKIGEDPTRAGLLETPRRVEHSLAFLTSGYTADLDAQINGAVFHEETDDMVVVKNIEIYSLCEHHMLPFFGKVHIAYVPDGKILGLSKFARIVDHYARRLQVQERLTRQIADAVISYLSPKGVGVIVEAQHLCMMMRGVQKQNSAAVTSCMRGNFRSDARTRTEFLRLVGQ